MLISVCRSVFLFEYYFNENGNILPKTKCKLWNTSWIKYLLKVLNYSCNIIEHIILTTKKIVIKFFSFFAWGPILT